MEEMIETRAAPEAVWEVWERAHALQGQKGIEPGQKGTAKFRYRVLDVKRGESFSILWKTFFVRLIFHHSVKKTPRGSQIRYQVQIKGPFAWLVRYFLGPKIRHNLAYVLKAIVQQLENK